jgi:hypothetical protein
LADGWVSLTSQDIHGRKSSLWKTSNRRHGTTSQEVVLDQSEARSGCRTLRRPGVWYRCSWRSRKLLQLARNQECTSVYVQVCCLTVSFFLLFLGKELSIGCLWVRGGYVLSALPRSCWVRTEAVSGPNGSRSEILVTGGVWSLFSILKAWQKAWNGEYKHIVSASPLTSTSANLGKPWPG